jgi:SHS2 domain-containing protein
MKHYEFIEHTADIGVKAYGKNLSEAFKNAAVAMFDIITDKSKIDIVGEYEIHLDSPDLEQLLVDWLSELLFLNSANNLVFSDFKVRVEKNHLSAKIFGEEYDNSKHNKGTEIKAVTYHMLEVNNKKPYFVKVLFDI